MKYPRPPSPRDRRDPGGFMRWHPGRNLDTGESIMVLQNLSTDPPTDVMACTAVELMQLIEHAAEALAYLQNLTRRR